MIVWTLNRAAVNSRKLIGTVITTLRNDGVQAASEECQEGARPHRGHPLRLCTRGRPRPRGRGEGHHHRGHHRDGVPRARPDLDRLGVDRRAADRLPRHGVRHDQRLRGHRQQRHGQRPARGLRHLRGADDHRRRSDHRAPRLDVLQLVRAAHRPVRHRDGGSHGRAGRGTGPPAARVHRAPPRGGAMPGATTWVFWTHARPRRTGVSQDPDGVDQRRRVPAADLLHRHADEAAGGGPVDGPAGQVEEATSVTVRESNVATIRVLPSNALTLDGELIVLTRVRQAIVERLAGNDQTIVVLETHPDADYGMMIACLDEVKHGRPQGVPQNDQALGRGSHGVPPRDKKEASHPHGLHGRYRLPAASQFLHPGARFVSSSALA